MIVEESLDISTEVQMHLRLQDQGVQQSIKPTWMASVSLKVTLVHTSGATLWEQVRMVAVLTSTVPALTVINSHHHLSETITTVSQLIKGIAG